MRAYARPGPIHQTRPKQYLSFIPRLAAELAPRAEATTGRLRKAPDALRATNENTASKLAR